MKLKPPPMKLKPMKPPPMKPPPMKPPPMKPPPMKPPRQPSLPGRDARIDRYNAIESGLLRWRCSQVFEGERALGVGEGGLGPRFSTESGFSGWRCSQSAAAVLVAVIVEYESNPRVTEATRTDDANELGFVRPEPLHSGAEVICRTGNVHMRALSQVVSRRGQSSWASRRTRVWLLRIMTTYGFLRLSIGAHRRAHGGRTRRWATESSWRFPLTPIATFCWSYPSIGDPRPCLIWRKRHGECLMIIIACSLASRVECRQNICVMIV
jgi:hypothetical protein